MSYQANSEMHGLVRWSREGIPANLPQGKQDAGMMFVFWLSGLACCVALNCLLAPLMALTGESEVQTQEVTGWPGGAGLCWTLLEDCRIRTRRKRNLHFPQTLWKMNPLLQKIFKKVESKLHRIVIFIYLF